MNAQKRNSGVKYFRRVIVLLAGYMGMQQAYAWESGCDSEQPCIDAHGMEVRIITLADEEHAYKIPMDTEEERLYCTDSYPSEACRTGTIECREVVKYPEFRAKNTNPATLDPGALAFINSMVKKEAALSGRCNAKPHSVSVSYQPERIYAHLPLISIVAFGIDYCSTCGGSCHGNYKTETFDTRVKSAVPVALDIVIDKKEYPALREALLQNFRSMYKERTSGEGWGSILKSVGEYLDENIWKNGFFVEGGKVRINIGEFLFSCAEGNYNPVDIPEKFIKPEFLALLQEQKE